MIYYSERKKIMKNNEVEIQKNNKQIHFLNEQLETLYETNNAAIDAGANFGFYNYQAIFKNDKNIRGNITDALDICKNNNLKIETKEIIKCFSDISDRMNFMEDDYIEDEFPEFHLDVSDMCFPDISKFVSKCLEKYDEKSVLVLDSYSCISIEQNNSENIEVNCVPYNEFGKEIARYINAEIVELDNEGHIIFQGVESEQLSFFDSTPSITKYSIIISEKIQSALNADNIIALSRNLCDDGKMMFATDYRLPYNQQTNDEVLTLNKAGIYVDAIIDLDYSWLYTFKKYRNRLYIFSKRNSSEVILGKVDISELDDFSELMFCGESDETEFVRVNDKEAVCYHDYIFNQLLNKAAKEYNGKIMYLKETEADFRKSRNNTNTLYFSLAEGNSCMHTFPDTERVYQHLTTIKLNEDVLLSRVASNFYNSYLGKKIVREYCIEHFGICWPRKYKHILELPVVVYDIKKQLEYVRTEEENEIIVKNMVDVLNKNFIELKNKCDSHEEFFEKLDSIYGQKSINNILSVEHKEAENEIIEIMHDFEKKCEVPNDSLINKLDIEEQENVKNYLITSNVVYHFLESHHYPLLYHR